MKKMFLVTSLLASALVVGAVTFGKEALQTSAAEELSLQSEGDAFKLLDKSYEEYESFVYTADLQFRGG